MADEPRPAGTSKADGDLLDEIRDNFKYASKAWHTIRDERAVDMRYVAGDPWDEQAKRERKDAGRPALESDLLTQFTNQVVNTLRQNKRGIKVDPVSQEATSKDAEFRQNLIRGIEYDSNAQECAYIPAFENAVQGSYGFWKVCREWVKGAWEQKIRIKGILNPDSVLFDPDVKESDWSDAEFCFICDPLTENQFKRRFPKAKRHDFSRDDAAAAPEWIGDDHVVVADYWKVFHEERELRDPDSGKRTRVEVVRSVKKYTTNGLEIMTTEDEIGSYIPVVPCIGAEKYITKGGRAERQLFSLVRLARDPFMFFCYLLSQMAEEASMSPKAPFVGYKGQFESDKVAWDAVNKVPRAYLQVDPMTDGTSVGQVLPLPARPQFTPNFQAYTLALDFAQRAVQAAMGIQPLPTAAQRQNEKSGVALEKIQSQEAIGAYHFTDNFDRALNLTGRILLEWIPQVYDTERSVGIVKEDGTRQVVKINSEPYMDEQGAAHHYPVIDDDGNPIGDFGVTISTGPSYDSQREDAASFVDTMIQNIQMLGAFLPPDRIGQLFALAIQLRNLGPLGDQMVDVIKGDPNSLGAQAQQAQMKLQQATLLIQNMQGHLQQLLMEKQGKVVEKQWQMKIEQMNRQFDIELQKLKNLGTVTAAEVNTKSQELQSRLEGERETFSDQHQAAHEFALQKDQQAADQILAQQQAQAAQAQMAQQAMHDQQAQQNQPAQ